MQGLVSSTRSLVCWILGPLLAKADRGMKKEKYVQCLIHYCIDPFLATRIIGLYLIAGVLWQELVHWILHIALLSQTPKWGAWTSLRAKPELFRELMQIMVLLTLASGHFWLFSHQNARSETGLCITSALWDTSFSRCNGWEQNCTGNTTVMVFEEVLNAEFLVSLRTSIHFPSYAFTKRALYGCGKLDRI